MAALPISTRTPFPAALAVRREDGATGKWYMVEDPPVTAALQKVPEGAASAVALGPAGAGSASSSSVPQNKTPVVELKQSPMPLPMRVRAGMYSSASRRQLKPESIRLSFIVKVTSSAATQLQLVQGLAPSASAEWTSLQNLYDEVKVTAAQYHYAAGTADAALTCEKLIFGVCYNPLENTSPTGLEVISNHRQHQLDVLSVYGQTGGYSTQHNLRVFKISVPTGDARDSAIPGVLNAGTWGSTLANDSWGYLKVWCHPQVTTTTDVMGVLYLDCMLRCRS